MEYRRKTIEVWKSHVFMIMGLILGIIIGFIVMVSVHAAQAEEEFISPITGPVIWTTTEEVEVPVLKTNILDIVDAIHMLESSRGKAGIGLQQYCEDKGMSNEYGYGGMQLKMCFRNHKEATGRVTLWVAEKLEKFNGDIATTACFYNLGIVTSDCEYAVKLMKLI